MSKQRKKRERGGLQAICQIPVCCKVEVINRLWSAQVWVGPEGSGPGQLFLAGRVGEAKCMYIASLAQNVVVTSAVIPLVVYRPATLV